MLDRSSGFLKVKCQFRSYFTVKYGGCLSKIGGKCDVSMNCFESSGVITTTDDIFGNAAMLESSEAAFSCNWIRLCAPNSSISDSHLPPTNALLMSLLRVIPNVDLFLERLILISQTLDVVIHDSAMHLTL